MTIAQSVSQKIAQLPPEEQRRVLRFIESLQTKTAAKKPLRDPAGLWAGRGVDISKDSIAEARKEMWGSFPRGDI
jgi:hypothetical protein